MSSQYWLPLVVRLRALVVYASLGLPPSVEDTPCSKHQLQGPLAHRFHRLAWREVYAI